MCGSSEGVKKTIKQKFLTFDQFQLSYKLQNINPDISVFKDLNVFKDIAERTVILINQHQQLYRLTLSTCGGYQ